MWIVRVNLGHRQTGPVKGLSKRNKGGIFPKIGVPDANYAGWSRSRQINTIIPTIGSAGRHFLQARYFQAKMLFT